MVILFIITTIVLSFSLTVSVLMNKKLYRAYMDLIGFFDSQDEEIADDFNYFDNLCKKELLMNDPYVVEMIKRLRRARDRYKTYIQARKVDKEKRETNPHNEKAEEAL